MSVVFKSLGCLAMTLGLNAVLAQSPSPTVAVLDFTIPATESHHWAWAEGGLADLLQIELEQLGLVTLDRDLIHAVLAEQRLASTGMTANDQLKVGSLLQARHLVTGKILSVQAKRMRLEVAAFSVEAVETVVTATGEGEFPKELSPVLKQVARQIAAILRSSGLPAAPAERAAPAPKPESLIMFYRGLNACARGQPELAAPWFMNSASLDAQFTAPFLWEIRAYELAGFERHAAIRREETAAALKDLGLDVASLSAGGVRSAKPVLAVLNPVLATLPATRYETTPVLLAATLKEALLATGRVRLFAIENLGPAVAEQDLKLSSFFARQYAPRYGRWLAADALVACQVSYLASDQVALDLALINPLVAATIDRVRRTGPTKDLLDLFRAAAKELVDHWRNAPGPQFQALPSAELSSSPTEDDGVELRPAFRNLASALAQARRKPNLSDAHRALANAFGATGRPRLAALEIERCLECSDIRAPNADKTYLATHRWLFWEPSPVSGAVGLVDQRLIDQFIQQLLTTYPQTLAAGCMHYNLAVTGWLAGNWQAASEQATFARQVIKPRLNEADCELELLAATYFLEGSSLRRLGKFEEARSVLRRGLDFMREFKVRDVCLPYGPWIGVTLGEEKVDGYGGDPPGIRTRLERELVTLEGKSARPSGLVLQRIAAEIVSATNALSVTPEEWLRCAEQIADFLDQAPPGDSSVLQGILSSASSSLNAARNSGAGDTALRPIVHKCVATFLAKQGMGALDKATGTSIEKLTENASEVYLVYLGAGLKEEAWAFLQPFFNDPYPVELALNLLMKLSWDTERYSQELSRAAARLSAGATNVSGAVWLKLGQLYFRNDRCREALDCYQKVTAREASSYPGLASALLEVALDRNLARPREEIERLRRELSFPPVEASWVEWFAAGRKYQTSRKYDLDKAIACYSNMLEFLEHPEQGGLYRLEKLPGPGRIGLRWGPSIREQDGSWSENYDSRWHSAAFYLAQCLIEVDQKEEAAQWLRRIALKAGGDTIRLLGAATWNGGQYQEIQIGVQAADLLKELHQESRRPKFGEADGPYQRPAFLRKARVLTDLPLPVPDPAVLSALTNVLVEWVHEPPPKIPHPRLEAFAQHYSHAAVPALLWLLHSAGALREEPALVWLLNQTATPADAPWLVAACRDHRGLIRVASQLAPQETAAALAEVWRAESAMGDGGSFLILQILNARLRPLYPLAINLVAKKKVNHLAVIVGLDRVVKEENSDELETAFREALSRCLTLKLQQKEYSELPRISQIALRHGVPEAIEALIVCEGSESAQLLKDVRPFVDLPAPENEAVERLRTNAGKWEWEPSRKKFTLPTPKS